MVFEGSNHWFLRRKIGPIRSWISLVLSSVVVQETTTRIGGNRKKVVTSVCGKIQHPAFDTVGSVVSSSKFFSPKTLFLQLRKLVPMVIVDIIGKKKSLPLEFLKIRKSPRQNNEK